MKASICMALYNGGKYLQDTINSILSQTFTDFEVIMVDDHSTDNTVDIALNICKQDNRFKLFCNLTDDEQPYIDAHNKSYEFATGEYLFRFDQDDIMHSNFLEYMINYLDEHKDVDAACCYLTGLDLSYKENIWKEYPTFDNYIEEDILKMFEISPFYYFYYTNSQHIWPIWHNNTSVLRRKFFVEHSKLRYPISFGGDYIFWLIAITEGAKLKIVNIPLVSYKHHQDSTSHSLKSNSYNDSNDLAQYIIAYYKYVGSIKELEKNIKVPENWIDFKITRDVFYNTAIFFKNNLIKNNEWDKIDDDIKL